METTTESAADQGAGGRAVVFLRHEEELVGVEEGAAEGGEAVGLYESKMFCQARSVQKMV